MTTSIDTTSQRFPSGPQPEADVCCLHTTEGMNWPGYSGGGEAPHATIWPLPGVGIKVREHIPTSLYAKALMNLPGGVETNRRGVLQYELVGTCDPAHRGKAGWFFWPDADDKVLAALADYLRPVLAKYAIPHRAPAFKGYPASYGANGVRMGGATWNGFNGICGHQHVPENLHGDPGAFPIAKLIAALGTAHSTTATKSATPVIAWQFLLGFAPARRDGAWGADTDQRSGWMVTAARDQAGTLAGSKDSTIRLIQRVIGTADDGVWGPASRFAISAWIRRAQGLLGVHPNGLWDTPTRAAYNTFRTANHH
jgi:hypothetical protein